MDTRTSAGNGRSAQDRRWTRLQTVGAVLAASLAACWAAIPAGSAADAAPAAKSKPRWQLIPGLGAPPFKYTYRITGLTFEAEHRGYGATATTRLRLDGPSKLQVLSWFGPKPTGGVPRAVSVAALFLEGEVAYSSSKPGCSSRYAVRSSRSHPVKSTLVIDPFTYKTPRIRVSVGRFPVARSSPGDPDGDPRGCGTGELRGSESAQSIVPASVMEKPRFVVSTNGRWSYGGAEFTEWKMDLTVTRLRYHLIDCATESGC
jgi:hypothetical protein